MLSVATTAGIMGVKRTADLIPMCHILPITNCRIRFEKDAQNLEILCFCTVKVTEKDRSRDGSTHWSQCGASDNL